MKQKRYIVTFEIIKVFIEQHVMFAPLDSLPNDQTIILPYSSVPKLSLSKVQTKEILNFSLNLFVCHYHKLNCSISLCLEMRKHNCYWVIFIYNFA